MQSMKKPTKAHEDRREQIIRIALEQAAVVGYQNVNRNHICKIAGVSRALVNVYIGSRDDLQFAIVQRAVAEECIPVIAQMLVMRDPYVKGGLSPAITEKVIEYIRAA